MKILATFVLVLLAITAFSQQQPETLKQNITFQLDEHGNGDLEVIMKLNATQWDVFKKTTGNNVSILKREMERALPNYFLRDFKYDEIPMERTYSLKFKALGMAKMKTKDRWMLEMQMKNPDINKMSDNVYLMTANLMQNGMIVQQISKLIFPSGTSDVKQEKDSFGNAVFTFNNRSLGSGAFPSMLILGILLILFAGFRFFQHFKPV